jgi:molybdopterin-guanine dinucleotide biosynthesis protein A
MIRYVVDALSQQTDRMAVSANGNAERYASFGYPVLADTIAGFAGPLAGILAGLQWAERLVPRPTHVATVVADAPFLPQNLVARLQQSVGTQPITLASSHGRLHPVFGLWPLSMSDQIAAWLLTREERAVRAFLDEYGYSSVAFDELPDPFFNVNTPDDLASARLRLERMLA